jgi:uncharacterized protein YvpB
VTEHCVVLTEVTSTGLVYADPWDASLKTADYASFEAGFAQIGNRAVALST